MEKKLPILATLVAAFELCREHFSYALKIMAPWFLAIFIAPYLLRGFDNGVQALPRDNSLQGWEILVLACYVIGWGSIAVLWHWRVLRDDSQSQKAVTFDRRVWFYLLRGILISIIVGGIALLLAIPIILIGSGAPEGFGSSAAFFVMVAGLLIIIGLVAARLSIALPAIALNVPNFGLGSAWNATAGNGIRLLVVTSLPLLPMILLSWGLDASGAEQGDLYQLSPPFVLLHLVFQLTDFAFALLSLTVLSLAYAFFVESGRAGGVQET